MTADELYARQYEEIRLNMRSSGRFFVATSVFSLTCTALTFLLPAYTWYAAGGAVLGAGVAVARAVRDLWASRERTRRFRAEWAFLRSVLVGREES